MKEKLLPYPGYMTREQRELENQWLAEENTMIDTLDRIAYERGAQDKKWGEQNHTPAQWMSILGEEFGEVCLIVNKTIENHGQALDRTHYEFELIQVAAVCVAAIENIRRQHGEPASSAIRKSRVKELRTDYR